MTELSAYKTILDAATNPASEPKPKEIHLNRDLAIHIFGEQAVDFTRYHKYNGVDVEVCLRVTEMHLLYGDYDVKDYR